MTNILFILAHPKEKSLNHEIYVELKKSIDSKNKDVIKTIDLYKDKFDASSMLTREDSEEKLVVDYQKLLLWSDHIIFIFPVWWYNYPAILKGFFDRILVPGFAFKYGTLGVPEALLRDKTSTIIRTFGSPRIAKLWFGNGNLKGLIRGTLKFCGILNQEVFDLHDVNLKTFNEEKFQKFIVSIKKLKLK